MNEALVRQLSVWLAATDIGWLELRGPGVDLRLRNDGKSVEPVPAGAVLDAALAATVPVKASSVGIFLHAHPLHETPLAAPDQPVTAGQIIGLLRIGALLLPVTAPQGGTCLERAAAHGSAVGYGTTLVHLAPDAPT